MKKVLIISLSAHNTLGGTQNYNTKLIHILQANNYKVTEYNCNVVLDKPNGNIIDGVEILTNSSITSPSSFRPTEAYRYMKQVNVADFEISQLVNNNDYDLIIDSRQYPYSHKKKYGREFVKDANCVWVQHFSPGIYSGEHITNKFFTIFTKLFMGGKRNVLYAHDNLVLYDEYNLRKLIPARMKGKNVDLVPLSHKVDLVSPSHKFNFEKRKYEIAYIGRIIQFQKNINFLFKASKNIKTKINVWGNGDEKIINKISKTMTYNGFIPQEKIDSVLRELKFLVVCSQWEGFSFILVQAMMNGTIPIVIDTYPSAKYLTKFGFLLKSSIKPKAFAEEINMIMNMDEKHLIELSKKNMEFAKQNLSEEKFTSTWKEIIQKYTK